MEADKRSRLKTGRRPQNLMNRTYKSGEILCEEGSRGREMFILKQGAVDVFKNTEDGRVHLATIGANGMIGEMSLLDNLPRSATVVAREPTAAAVVSESIFQNTLQKAPIWLTSILKIVVSRLRDANKRVSRTALRDKTLGVVSLIDLLLPESGYRFGDKQALGYNLLLVETFFVCKLRRKEVEECLKEVEKRQVISIAVDSDGNRHVCITDPEAFELYHEYLALRSRKKEFKEKSIPDLTVALLSNIAYLAQKSGKQTESGVALSKRDLLKDLSDKTPQKLDRHLLELRRLNIISEVPHGEDSFIVFEPKNIRRIHKIKKWLPRFELEAE